MNKRKKELNLKISDHKKEVDSTDYELLDESLKDLMNRITEGLNILTAGIKKMSEEIEERKKNDGNIN